jgi:predicted negative regulator of RcsB-dependent stress response
VALNAAEEESIEALKKWWEDNGTLVTTVVVTVALIWGGWSFWQNSQQGTVAAASDRYEEILTLVSTEPGISLSDADRARVIAIADELKSEHGDSVYALYGALFAAQQAVIGDNLETAEAQLRWLLDNAQGGFFSQSDQGLLLTANLRLGRILLAKGEAQQALDLIDGLDPGAFEAEFAELRGDIYVAQGRPVDARDAYTTAQQAAGGVSAFLQMKLDQLVDES